MKKVILIILLVLVVIVAAAIAIPLVQLNAAREVDETTVEIPNNATTAQIGALLVENNVVNSNFIFKLYLRMNSELAGQLKAGVYTFNGSYTVAEVVNELTKGGAPVGIKVTIPEGYNRTQIAETLAENDIVAVEAFIEACQNGDYPYDYLPAPGSDERLQGYLYPETYFFPTGVDAEAVVQMMLAEFDKQFNDEWRAQLVSRDLTMNDLVIMASIVEREAVVTEDRPIIAGVFYNRLAANMKLQSCATVQYALGEVKPVLTYADLAVESPYNTYIVDGLPPGPICSPGYASLKAALFPTETDYLYFVAKNDGSHVFSITYDEHLAAKAAIEKGDM